MKSSHSFVSCPICNSRRNTLLYPANISKKYFDLPYKISSSDYGQHLDIFICSSCHTYFENVTKLQNAIKSHYRTLFDTDYEQGRPHRTLAFRRVLNKIRDIKSHGKLLDIGCATGAFLMEAKKHSYTVYGVEPSTWGSSIARKKYHLNVQTKSIENINFPDNYFDVVTLLDVIEHLYDPATTLKRISIMVKKGGLICVVTPNVSSLASKMLREKWWHIRPSHFFYFSPPTIKRLFKQAKLKIIVTRQYVWYLSLAYLLTRLLKLVGINFTIKSNMLDKIPISINLGDSMEIYAIKQ